MTTCLFDVNESILAVRDAILQELADPWADWSPGISQGGSNLTFTLAYAKWRVIARSPDNKDTMEVVFRLTMIDAGPSASSINLLNLPRLPELFGSTQIEVGMLRYIDISSGVQYWPGAFYNGSNVVMVLSGQNSLFGVLPAITVGTGDIVAANFIYPAESP